jgi:glycosyltransferase involved in cell wall biosynthesis
VKSYPKISIVIPSFNKVKYINKTFDSIFAQKYPNLEVIIQDGGSTDGTLDIIKKYAKRYSEIIRWESKKDKGQLDAINKGFGKATGEILAYVNADDVYETGSFESVAELFSSHPNSPWFAGRGKVIDSSGKEIAKFVTWYKNLLLSLNSRFFLLVNNYLMQPSVFITRNAWKKFGSFTGTPDFVTEYDLWLKMAKDKMPVVSDKYFSDFRIERSTITKTDTVNLLSEDERIVRKSTDNSVILFLHRLHNWVRRFIGETV